MARVMVTEQDGQRHVSTTPLSDEEAAEHLALEAFMHRAAGWSVAFGRGGEGGTFVAIKTKRGLFSTRVVTRMVSTAPYDPSVSS